MGRASSIGSDPCINEMSRTSADIELTMQTVQDITVSYTDKLNALASGKNEFARRLTLLKQMGADLDAPADDLERLAKDFSSEVGKIDDSVLAIFDLLSFGKDVSGADKSATVRESINGLYVQTAPTFVSVREFDAILKKIEPLSRDLRKPIRKMRSALSSLLSTEAVFEKWHTMAAEDK